MDIVLDILRDPKVLATIEIFAVAFLVVVLARSVLRRSSLPPDQKVRIRSLITSGAFFIAITILFSIWADTVRELLVALTAFAVAGVIGSKEMILCVLGWVYKVFSNTHHTGDRIQVGDLRGDVVAVRILSSTLAEVDKQTEQSTGRLVTLPHALLLTMACYNESQGEGFRWLEFSVPVNDAAEVGLAREVLERVVEPIHREHRDTIIRRKDELEEGFAVNVRTIEPKVYLSVEGGKPLLMLRMPVLPRRLRDTKDRLANDYFRELAVAQAKMNASKPAHPKTEATSN
ncbi:MAG: hypothetical protein AMXMBFR7_01990 [Planctomycetota bacterium]